MPESIVQGARVAQTASPVLPSLLVYSPVTPVLSSLATAVALPLASVKISALSEGCSSSRATRMPIMPSLLSRKVTFWSSAVRVVMRSMERRPAPPRKT